MLEHALMNLVVKSFEQDETMREDRDVEITYTGADGLDHTEYVKYSGLPSRLEFLEARGAQMVSWSFARV